jgi:hypothetical protein
MSTARANLQLKGGAILDVGTVAGTLAAGDDGRILGAAQKSANLGDLLNPAAARANLSLAGAALLNVGTTPNTVAAGDDGRIVGAAQQSANLGDLLSPATARINLGAGIAGGLATLDNTGKLSPSQVPDSLVGAVVFQGVWDASLNSPHLASGVGTQGDYYRVNVAGTTSINGIASWAVGDTIIFDGTAWAKIPGTPSTVFSVAGRTGAIVLSAADISGLGGSALLNVGTAAGTVAAGNDSRISGAAQKSANLGDLLSPVTARVNLGLGGASILNIGTTAGTVAAGNDSRILGAAQKSANLSDMSIPAVRANLAISNVENTALSTFPGSSNITTLGNVTSGSILASLVSGLGNAATRNVGTGAGMVAAGNDSRIGTVQVQSNGVNTTQVNTVNFDAGFTITYTGGIPTIAYNGAAPSGEENFEVMYNPSNPTWGAIGNSVADDFVQLQNCCNDALASGARAVYLPVLYLTSRTLNLPLNQDFKIPYIASVNTTTFLFAFSLEHGFFDGDPIMIQGAYPNGTFSGHVYYMGRTGNSPTSTVGALYNTPANARAGGATGLVSVTTNVTTTGSITGGQRTLTVAAELNDQLGTNVLIAGAAGASGGFYITGGVGTLSLTLNTAANVTRSGVAVTYVAWVDWRFFKDGFYFRAAPGAGLQKHHTFNTLNGSSLINLAIGSGLLFSQVKFVGLSNMFVPDGVTATTINGSNDFTVNSPNTDWVIPGMTITISGASSSATNGLIVLRGASGSTVTSTDPIVGSVTNSPVGQQITSGVYGMTGTGTIGSTNLTVSSVDGIPNGTGFRIDTISGTYSIISQVGLNLVISPALTGSVAGKLLIPTSLTAGDDGLRVGSCHNVLVEHCSYYHFGDTLFRLQTNVADYSAAMPNGDANAGVNTGQVVFFKNYAFNCYQSSSTTNDYVHGGAKDVWFIHNEFDHLRGSVKFASRTPGAKNLFLLNNIINGSNNHGFELDSYSNVHIIGNELKDIINQGIFMLPNNGTAGTFGLGIVGFTFDGLYIQGNTFDNVGYGQGALACLRMDMDQWKDGTLFNYYGVTIRDNIVKNIANPAHVGFNFVSGSYVNVDISRNDFQNYNGLNPIKMTMRPVSGLMNAISIRQNKINMNNAGASGIWVQGTSGANLINEVQIEDNYFSGLCTRALVLDNVNNISFQRNRTASNFTGTWYLTNNDSVTNMTWANNNLETTNTFGASLGGITGLYMHDNVHKINPSGGTSTISLSNSCSNVFYYDNVEIGGVPNFRQIPVATKAPPSVLRREELTAIPTTGTWTAGSIIDIPNFAGTHGISQYICSVGGTADTTVSGAPTATTDGTTNIVTFSSLAAIANGCWFNLAGAWTGARQISLLNFSNNTGTISGAVPTAVTGAAITYVAPTFVQSQTPGGPASFSDADYQATSTDRQIIQTGTLTAPRTVTLPLAASVPKGTLLVVSDDSGTCGPVNTIIIARNTSDGIHGLASIYISTPWGSRVLESNGVNKWTIVSSGLPSTATKTGAYVASMSDNVILADATAAGFHVTLPTAVGRGGKTITVKKIDASVNAVVVDTTSGQTIDNVSTKSLTTQYQSLNFNSDNANWWLI